MKRSDQARQTRAPRPLPALHRPPRSRRARERRLRRLLPVIAGFVVLIIVLIAVLGSGGSSTDRDPALSSSGGHAGNASVTGSVGHAPADPDNVYSGTAPADLSSVVKGDPQLVYVPNTLSNTVDIISQRTLKVIGSFATGALPQHVTPAWNLKTLWVDNDVGNTLTPINPRTAKPGKPIPVEDPYNLYFTPDGRYAIVVAERLRRLDFRQPNTMRLKHSLSVPMCAGVDHMDFSADGRYAYASCEFASRMIEVDLRSQKVIRTLSLDNGSASPQDVKLSPDGQTLYSADQMAGGLWEINPNTFKVMGFLKTGAGAHGLYPSRNDKYLYVSNRQAGTISVVSFATKKVVKTWQLPLPASPDMGNVSADGKTLWLSGRYNSVVYAINTITGKLRAAIPVGDGPHGICVWPQPGSYSLGHTGILR
jgi:DNA-binding beta-propeller fold protein YncE